MMATQSLLILCVCLFISKAWSLPIQSRIDQNNADFPGRGRYGEDDMILTVEQMEEFLGIRTQSQFSRSGVNGLNYRWPGGKVYYEISTAFSSSERNGILQAMAHIASRTCIRFLPKTSTTVDYINIDREKNTCSAQVGRVGGKQRLNLGSGCMSVNVIAHELVHALGFWHEQSRYDRDDWVTINWSNIPEDKRHNFNRFTSSQVNVFDLPYDYKSLMHYGGYDFAFDRSQPTIIPKNSGIDPRQLSNPTGLTQWDAEKINRMYRGIC